MRCNVVAPLPATFTFCSRMSVSTGFGRDLMATFTPVGKCTAASTCPKLPRPSTSPSSYSARGASDGPRGVTCPATKGSTPPARMAARSVALTAHTLVMGASRVRRAWASSTCTHSRSSSASAAWKYMTRQDPGARRRNAAGEQSSCSSDSCSDGSLATSRGRLARTKHRRRPRDRSIFWRTMRAGSASERVFVCGTPTSVLDAPRDGTLPTPGIRNCRCQAQ